jgi:hypothetical protein
LFIRMENNDSRKPHNGGWPGEVAVNPQGIHGAPSFLSARTGSESCEIRMNLMKEVVKCSNILCVQRRGNPAGW